MAATLDGRLTSGLIRVLLDRGRFTRREAIAIAVASAVFAIAFCFPLIPHIATQSAFNDWDEVLAYEWSAYWSVAHYYQLPVWNPFLCGGMPLLGSPNAHFLTPLFVLTLIFGPATGLHLDVIALCAIGWAGGYVLGRLLEMRRISAIGTATAFAGSSWFFLHASEGHFVFMSLAYLPWIVAAAWTASAPGKLRYAAACGALIALTFFEGGPYPALFAALTVTLLMLFRAALEPNPNSLIALAVSGAFAAGFGAFKVLPALEVLASHPRPTDDTWYNPVSVLVKALLSHDQSHNRAFVNGWGFWEVGAYVGLFAVIALPSCMVPRKSLVWILAGVVFFLLGWGAFSPHAPWVWLHKLPGFSSTRLPGRFLIPFTLVVAVLAGFGLDIVCKDGSAARAALAASLVMIGGIDMLVVGSPNLKYVLEAVSNPGPPRSDFVQYHRDPVSVQSSVIRHHEGVINCYVSPAWQTAVMGWNQPGYRGEQYLEGPGSVQLRSWSPNVLQFEVDTPAPSILVVNQNYDRWWRVMSGAEQTRSLDGLLSVPVSAGKNLIILRYLSLSALLGLVTTLVTTLGAVVLAWIERRPGAEVSGTAS